MSRLGDALAVLRGGHTSYERQLEAKQSASGPSIAAFTAGQPQRIKTNYAGFADEGYGRNAAMHKAVDDMSTCVGSVELHAFEIGSTTAGEPIATRVPDHPLERVVRNPNPVQDRSEYMKELTIHKFLAGEYFMESVNAQEDTPDAAELYLLRPDRMEVLPASDGLPRAYRHRASGGPVTYELDPVTTMGDVVHRRLPNPLSDWRGLSPFAAAAFGLDTHNAANRWNLTSLEHGARPPAVLTIENSTPEARQQLRAEMDERFAGVDQGRKLMVLGGNNAKLNLLSYSAVELDWLLGKFQSAREICWAVGYPSFLLGMPGDSTFNNQAEARLALWEQQILPILGGVVATLNHWLAPRLDRRRTVVLRPDLESIPALSIRREQLWERATKADWLSTNEKRALTGYSERDEPEANDILVDASKLPLGTGDDPPPEE